MVDAAALALDLAAAGVAGATITWADYNGIPRSRTVPVTALPQVAERGIGVSTVSVVFDTHDHITYAHADLSTPSGDVRLIPDLRAITRLAGQPALAWAPGRLISVDGSPWPYDPRSVLEAQVQAAAAEGLEIKAGYEMEFVLTVGDGSGFNDAGQPQLAYQAPAYSPHALLAVDEFISDLLADLAANGVPVNQLHAEYGPAQVELSIVASDPITAANRQLLARQTIHAAARVHGLRACFAPLFTATDVGNGWHVHTSVWRDGRNLLASHGTADRPGPTGAGWLGGLLRDLRALAAITAPSVPSLARLRPGYFSSAYHFWGVENREAPLRYVLGSDLLGADHANVELKVSDASANPYLALAALVGAGLAGLRDSVDPGEPIQTDPGRWSEQERAERGVVRLPTTPAEQEEALTANKRLTAVLGDQLLGAFLAVRRSDAAWAADRSLDDIVAAHRWRY